MASKASAAQTRRRSAHFALGQPSKLSDNSLPLEVDIFNKCKKMKEDNPNATQKSIASSLAEEIVEVWQ